MPNCKHYCRLIMTACGLLAAGCATGPGGSWAANRQTMTVPVSQRSTPTVPPPIVRGQDDNTGLWDFPSWDELRKNPAVNGFMKLFGRDRNESLAEQQFKQAEEAFEQKRYDEAASLYNKASHHWPDSPVEEDSLFMLGECYFFMDKYPSASDAYAELLKKYENSRHLDKIVLRQFRIAQYWLDLQRYSPRFTLNPNLMDRTRPTWDTRGNAIKAYDSVRMSDPTGPLADDSIFATANEYFLNDQFDNADYHFSLLRSEYPKSEHLIKAYILGLRAKLRKYDGPQYDSQPLAEAEELIDQMLSQFGPELGDERERVIQAGRAVRAQMAQRDYEMAEFYCKTRHYGSASVYFNNVVKDFPETKFAEMSQARLEEIKDLPPVPPERLKWLANLFPGQSKRRFK